MAPITALMGKDAKLEWGEKQKLAKAMVVDEMTKPGKMLRSVRADKPLYVYSDRSKDGIAAILCQPDEDGKEHLCACASRTLNRYERNYSPTRGEQLALVYAVRTFRAYLHGTRFTLFTDHQPLVTIVNQDAFALTGQAMRWNLILSEFDFDVKYVKGADQKADMPSRLASGSSEDSSTGTQFDRDGAPADGAANKSSEGASTRRHAV